MWLRMMKPIAEISANVLKWMKGEKGRKKNIRTGHIDMTLKD